MKKYLMLLALLIGNQYSYAQKAPIDGKYTFFCDAIGKQKGMAVKGTFLGRYPASGTNDWDFYLEKVDALNHKLKIVRLVRDKFSGMDVHSINEAALSINDLSVKANTGKGKDKLPFVVTLKNLKNDAEKDRIQHKTYTAHAGDYNKTEYGVETTAGSESVDVFFPTKAQAEEFISDIKARGLR
jgi:hypothetical protein